MSSQLFFFHGYILLIKAYQWLVNTFYVSHSNDFLLVIMLCDDKYNIIFVTAKKIPLGAIKAY